MNDHDPGHRTSEMQNACVENPRIADVEEDSFNDPARIGRGFPTQIHRDRGGRIKQSDLRKSFQRFVPAFRVGPEHDFGPLSEGRENTTCILSNVRFLWG